MESDKHVCVRQEAAGSKQVKISIVDLANPNPPETHGINADSAILNPMTEIIALKGALRALHIALMHVAVISLPSCPCPHCRTCFICRLSVLLLRVLSPFLPYHRRLSYVNLGCAAAETNSGQVLQIFNLKVKVRMKHHTITDNDKVIPPPAPGSVNGCYCVVVSVCCDLYHSTNE